MTQRQELKNNASLSGENLPDLSAFSGILHLGLKVSVENSRKHLGLDFFFTPASWSWSVLYVWSRLALLCFTLPGAVLPDPARHCLAMAGLARTCPVSRYFANSAMVHPAWLYPTWHGLAWFY